MAVPTLNGIDLNGISSIRPEKSANIIPIPMPTGDSDETEIFDMLGVVKIISVIGTYSAGTIASTKTFIDSLEALSDGNQETVEFISDQTGTISVMVSSVGSNWELPGFKVDYDIKLIQGI